MRTFTKRSAVIATVSALALSGGAAFAFNGWSVNGSGKANASASKITELTATSTFADAIYPGLKTKVSTVVINLNDFPVQLTSNSAKIVDITVKGGSTPRIADDTARADDSTRFDPAIGECKTGLAKDGVINTDFPGNPVVPSTAASKTGHTITSNVTFGSIPQACAGKSIEIKYTFAGVSHA